MAGRIVAEVALAAAADADIVVVGLRIGVVEDRTGPVEVRRLEVAAGIDR